MAVNVIFESSPFNNSQKIYIHLLFTKNSLHEQFLEKKAIASFM